MKTVTMHSWEVTFWWSCRIGTGQLSKESFTGWQTGLLALLLTNLDEHFFERSYRGTVTQYPKFFTPLLKLGEQWFEFVGKLTWQNEWQFKAYNDTSEGQWLKWHKQSLCH